MIPLRTLGGILCLLIASARADEVEPSSTVTLSQVELYGKLRDPKDRLLQFWGLNKGALFDRKRLSENERGTSQFAEDLRHYGYRVLRADLEGNGHFVVEVAPMQTLRKIVVRGNFPLPDDDILRRLPRLRSGLWVSEAELTSLFEKEAADLAAYLEHDGFFGSRVSIAVRGRAPEYIDLDVYIKLGNWYRLGSILPDGNHALTNPNLNDTFSHCCWWWARFSENRVREDTRRAEEQLQHLGFPGARVKPDFDLQRDLEPVNRKIRLRLHVLERRHVEVIFSGNKALSDSKLKHELTIFDTGSYDDAALSESATKIEHAYQQQGYFEARARFVRHREGGDRERVEFIVDEGFELGVRKVELLSEAGTPLSFSEDHIKNEAGIETKVGGFLVEGGFLTSTQLMQDLERVGRWYRAKGFPLVSVRAEVARDLAAFDNPGLFGVEMATGAPGRDLFVRFFVSEGRSEWVGGVAIHFDGDWRQIRSVLKMLENSVFSSEQLEADKAAVRRLLANHGHPYAKVIVRETWDLAHEHARLDYLVESGALVRFGPILIRGNFHTRSRVIARDLSLCSGMLFDMKALDIAEENLQSHGLFNSVSVRPAEGALEREENPVPILVEITERFVDDIPKMQIAYGASSDKPPHYMYIGFPMTFNNLGGFGTQLELRAEATPWVTDYPIPGYSNQATYVVRARYTDPRIFSVSWRLDISGFGQQEFTNRFGAVFSYGYSLGLTYKFSDALRTSIRYSFRHASVNSVNLVRVLGANDHPTEGDNTNTAKVTAGLVWSRLEDADGRPNPFAPHHGWLLAAAFGGAFAIPCPNSDHAACDFFFGDHNFLTLAVQAIGVAPIKIRRTEFTLIADLRVDHGIPLGSENALPAVERYFGGGNLTTRGFEQDYLKSTLVSSSVSPLGAPTFRAVPQGGDLRILSTIELQFPIAKFYGVTWAGAIFYDAGAIADAANLLGISDFKHSVGLSLLRLITPYFPISIDYAYPIAPTLAEQRWKTDPYRHFPGAIHFNIGLPLPAW